MTAAILVMLVSVANTPFIADATAEREFIVHRPESIVRSRIEDIQVLWRNMPGVVAITAYDATFGRARNALLGSRKNRFRARPNVESGRDVSYP